MSKRQPRDTSKPRRATPPKPASGSITAPEEKKENVIRKPRATTKSSNNTSPVPPIADAILPAPLINKADNTNALPETTMEVHHHPELPHGPKSFKQYLLEGFMIFIAVMMGFVAESIRESITHSEHVHQLTSQLIEDLKADTTQLNKIYKAELEINKSNDTLFSLLQQPLQKADIKKIQRLVVNAHNLWLFHSSAGAISAIKNELHLKQFSDSRIISYISAYEADIELLQTVQNITLQYQRSFLDPFLRLHFTPENLDAAFNQHVILNGQMRNLTQEDITQLAADMVLIKLNSKELADDNQKLLKKDATALLEYVKKQYDHEGE